MKRESITVPPLTDEQVREFTANWKQLNIGTGELRVADIRCKRERWFWLKRIAYWLRLRKQPGFWDITYEFTIEP